MRRICVFCGASAGAAPGYAQTASALGTELAGRGIGVVYGGGRLGLMGVVADSALAAGGEVVGVIPRGLVDRELAHGGLTELHVVKTMHERKALMNELSDGFVTLPGGLGTLEEVAEVVSWAQLGLHAKPIGVLNVAGYFDGLVDWLARAVSDGFVRPEHGALLLVEAELAKLLAAMEEHRPPRPRFPAVDPGVEPAAS
jgi:uncharacterized protein (TIGR00730 family)